MALISKKTFRKWAKALTARGLTFENAELFAEFGNTITIKQKRTQSGIFTIDQQAGTISWNVGAVWFNGGLVPIDGLDTGEEITLSFNLSDHREQTVYCRLDFNHHGELNEQEEISPPATITFYTATRADEDGNASFEVGFTEDETSSFLSTPATINTTTNAGTTGIKRLPVATLTWIEPDPPLIPFGFWSAEQTLVADPSKLIIFNLTDYSNSRTWPTINSMELV